MVYQVSLKKRVLKTLEDINEPYYNKIKEAIYGLADNPRPQGYKKLKGREGTAFVSLITVLSMIFSIISSWWM